MYDCLKNKGEFSVDTVSVQFSLLICNRMTWQNFVYLIFFVNKLFWMEIIQGTGTLHQLYFLLLNVFSFLYHVQGHPFSLVAFH